MCGAAVRRGDITVVMDTKHLELIESGRRPWSDDGRFRIGYGGFGSGYEGFGTDDVRPVPASSTVARELLGQVSGAATSYRKQLCEVGTTVLLNTASAFLNDADPMGDRVRVKNAYRAIAEYGEFEPAAGAAIQLGQLEQTDGNLQEALRFFRRATEAATDDGQMKPIAHLCLGGMLDHLGDLDGAKRAFRSCVDCGKSLALAEAGFRLGSMLRLEDPPAARAVSELAFETGDAKYAPRAAVNLGVIEDEYGRNSRKARKWWEYALAHGELHERTAAAYNIAWTFEREGRHSKARHYYRLAVDSLEGEAARRAREYLGGQD